MVDAHSKYIDAHIVHSSTTSATLAKFRQTFATHGIPRSIVSDNASTCTSQEFKNFCKSNGIKHVCSSAYHPSTNGLAERAVQTLKNGLRKTKGGDLESRMYKYLARYRQHLTPRQVDQTPAELLMKRKPRSRLDLVCPWLEGKVLKKQAAAVDGRGSVRQFYEGDTVRAMNFAGCPKWMPGVLQRQLGPVSFTVGLVDVQLWKRHVDHLRLRRPDEGDTPAREQRGSEPPLPPWDAMRSLGHPEAVTPPNVLTADSEDTVASASVPAKVVQTAAAAGREVATPAATKTSHPAAELEDIRSPGQRLTVQDRGDSAPVQPDEVTGPGVMENRNKPSLRSSTRIRAPDRLGLSNTR